MEKPSFPVGLKSIHVISFIAILVLSCETRGFGKNPPVDTAHHNFASGIYSITVNFDDSTIYYVIDYTADIPVLDTQTVQIAMNMNIENKENVTVDQILAFIGTKVTFDDEK